MSSGRPSIRKHPRRAVTDVCGWAQGARTVSHLLYRGEVAEGQARGTLTAVCESRAWRIHHFYRDGKKRYRTSQSPIWGIKCQACTHTAQRMPVLTVLARLKGIEL